jgi:hypothetical protein
MPIGKTAIAPLAVAAAVPTIAVRAIRMPVKDFALILINALL